MLFFSMISFNYSQASGNGVTDIGNGGGGILCSSSGKSSLKVLDLYDMEAYYGWTVSKDIPSDFEGALNAVFKRIKRFDPTFATELREEYRIYRKEVRFVEDPLPNIGDIGRPIEAPSSCSFKQLAIQWEEGSKYGRRFLINRSLWKTLDGFNQAALIIHELFYRIYLRHNRKYQITSLYIRMYVAEVFSNGILNWAE